MPPTINSLPTPALTLFLLKINAFTMRYDIWKGRKKSLPKGAWTRVDHVKRYTGAQFTICATGVSILCRLCCCICNPSCTSWLTAIYHPVSGESSIPRPMALPQTIPTFSGLSDLSLCFLTCCFVQICRCVFWLILFSNLSLCFLTCYNVFWIVVVFSDFFFFRFAFAFVICYFVFRIVICFTLLGHRSFESQNQTDSN